jgi:hypothetical protein
LFRSLLKKTVLKRFAVTLDGIEDTFTGILTQFDAEIYVFEDCWTVAAKEGASVHKIPGRLFVERRKTSYLQELP